MVTRVRAAGTARGRGIVGGMVRRSAHRRGRCEGLQRGHGRRGVLAAVSGSVVRPCVWRITGAGCGFRGRGRGSRRSWPPR